MEFTDYSLNFLHFHTDELPSILTKHLQLTNFSLADMGCGDGALLVALMHAGYFDKARRIVAIDLSQERLNRLKQYPRLELVLSDATDVPKLEADSMDYVINTQVIEHVPDEHKLLGEIRRMLRPGGTLYIASVVKKWYGWFYYRTAEGKWALDPTHIREYESLEQFEALIRSGGFQIIESKITPLRLSLMEFLVRRLVFPVFKSTDINGLFSRHRFLDFLRRNLNIHPPGYYIVEVVARKDLGR